MMLIGYCYSIRSDRRLCQDVDMNFAYRWFCCLGFEGRVPDHSTFSVNRHGRFRHSDVLRRVFESVVRDCMAAGLVGGEGFAVDASVIEADASRFKRVEGSEIDWSDEERARRPIREYLTALDSESTGEMLGWLVGHDIDPHRRVSGTCSRASFRPFSTQVSCQGPHDPAPGS